MQAEEVRDNLFWIHPPDGGEVYVLRTGDGLALFDTGLHRHREGVVAALRAAGLPPESIRLAFCTHLHCDHVGSMGWWRERFGFTVVAHAAAAPHIESGDVVITGTKIPLAGFDEDFLPCPVDRVVQGGETLTLGERTFTLIHAPGHTEGGLHVRTGDLLFVGDTLFRHGGIGWMDAHWGSNPSDYVETLERMRPDIGRFVCAGHMPPYVLEEVHIERGKEIAAFYIPLDHGLGYPRAPSQYPAADA